MELSKTDGSLEGALDDILEDVYYGVFNHIFRNNAIISYLIIILIHTMYYLKVSMRA